MSDAHKIAIVFPGQGSQSLGMLTLYDFHPAIVAAVEEVSQVVGVDFKEMIENDAVGINQTTNTQPILLALEVGLYRALALEAPVCMAGHSLGEYSALVCSGALSLSDAADIVRQRAQMMQSAVKDGGMLAILGLSVEAVKAACASLNQNDTMVWVANCNAEKQVVIAGLNDALEQAELHFNQAGARKLVRLPMSVPSHCPLLQPAAEQLFPVLAAATWEAPRTPIFHTASLAPLSADEQQANYYARLMSAQLTQAVNWLDILEKIKQAGATHVLECGPGRVLTGLGKASSLLHESLNSVAALSRWQVGGVERA